MEILACRSTGRGSTRRRCVSCQVTSCPTPLWCAHPSPPEMPCNDRSTCVHASLGTGVWHVPAWLCFFGYLLWHAEAALEAMGAGSLGSSVMSQEGCCHVPIMDCCMYSHCRQRLHSSSIIRDGTRKHSRGLEAMLCAVCLLLSGWGLDNSKCFLPVLVASGLCRVQAHHVLCFRVLEIDSDLCVCAKASW